MAFKVLWLAEHSHYRLVGVFEELCIFCDCAYVIFFALDTIWLRFFLLWTYSLTKKKNSPPPKFMDKFPKPYGDILSPISIVIYSRLMDTNSRCGRGGPEKREQWRRQQTVESNNSWIGIFLLSFFNPIKLFLKK